MCDSSILETIHEKKSQRGQKEKSEKEPSTEKPKKKKSSKRSDLTRAEQALIWLRSSGGSTSSTDNDCSETCATEDCSSSSFGSSLILEVSSSSFYESGTQAVDNKPLKTLSKSSSNKKKSKPSSKEKQEAQQQQQQKKNVRFVCDPLGNVICETHIIKKLSAKNRCYVWWTDEELSSIRSSCLKLAKSFQKNNSYMWAIDVLYCKNNSIHRPQQDEQDNEEEEDPTSFKQLQLEEQKLARKVLFENQDARGLEMHISPLSNDTMDRNFRIVLRGQKRRTEKELGMKVKSVSKVCVSFALALAEVDRMISLSQ